jgi:hypothetical protein
MASSAKHSVHFMPPLLLKESQDGFASFCLELKQDIKPRGVVERTYVHDIASDIWETQRLRRYKTVIINNSRLAALRKILEQLLYRRDYNGYEKHEQAAEDLARGWFENHDDKTKVAKLLRKFQMDEVAIEAEAFRSNAEDLERLDRMLGVLAGRRDKALRCIAEYRQSFSAQLQHAADRILDNDEVPQLIDSSRRSEADNGQRTEGATRAAAPVLAPLLEKSGPAKMRFDTG